MRCGMSISTMLITTGLVGRQHPIQPAQDDR